MSNQLLSAFMPLQTTSALQDKEKWSTRLITFFSGMKRPDVAGIRCGEDFSAEVPSEQPQQAVVPIEEVR